MEANFDQDFKIIFPLTTPALVCQTDIKGVPLVGDIFNGGSYVYVGQGIYEKSLYLCSGFLRP